MQNNTRISKSLIKRQTKNTRKNSQSKESERIRKTNARKNLDESSKQKVKAGDKKGKADAHENLDESAKEKNQSY